MRALAFDTNLLILLLVGRVDPRQISRHKRLKAFQEADYRQLEEILRSNGELITIPQCIAEVSNLAAQGVADPFRSEIMLRLKHLVSCAPERGVTSLSAVSQHEYDWLGVTDAAWLTVLDDNATLITEDSGLRLAAQSRGREAFSLSDFRR